MIGTRCVSEGTSPAKSTRRNLRDHFQPPALKIVAVLFEARWPDGFNPSRGEDRIPCGKAIHLGRNGQP